ncbi:MAG: response regulator [Pseudomonadota bacterium]
MALKDVLRVMVVDDMTTSRALIYECFDALGVTNVQAANNATDALKSVSTNPVHLIISDYNMPGMTGLDFLAAVRKNPKTAKTAFVLVSGSPDQTLLDKGRALAVNNYIKKPFTTSQLKKCVQQIFGPLQ